MMFDFLRLGRIFCAQRLHYMAVFLLTLPRHIKNIYHDLNRLEPAIVAAGLAFSSALSLVPIFMVIFAVFSLLPGFAENFKLMDVFLSKYFLQENIAKNVAQYLFLFAKKAQKLSLLNALFLLLTVWMMFATIEKVLNNIWRVPHKKPLRQRLIIYWGLITLFPLIFGLIFWLSNGLFGYFDISFSAKNNLATHALIVIFFTLFFAVIYMWLPNAHVPLFSALVGGVIAGVLAEILRTLFFNYVIQEASYTVIYGAIAAIPLLLIWFHLFWLMALLGAVCAAYIRRVQLPNDVLRTHKI